MPADLVISAITIDPPDARLGEQVVISAQVVAVGADAEHVTVLFSKDPEDPGLPDNHAFDVEYLPFVHQDRGHFVQSTFTPLACGMQTILLEAIAPPRGLGDEQTELVSVSMDTVAADAATVGCSSNMTTESKWTISMVTTGIRAMRTCKRYMDIATMRKRERAGTISRQVCVTSIKILRSGVLGNGHAPI